MGSQKAPAGKVMPRTGAEARRAGRAPAYSLVAALGLVVVCSLACARLLATHAPRLGTLLALPGDAGEDRVYGQIEGMNQKLRAENERLHKLLQRDENADIHVETRLQREDVRKSARLRQEMQREERLRAELDTVLGKAGQGRAADVVASGEAAESRRVREQSQVQSLLDAAKAQADEKLGLGDDSDVQRAFAADVDTALGPRESAMAEDGSERLGGAEGKRARLSARERRCVGMPQTAIEQHRTPRAICLLVPLRRRSICTRACGAYKQVRRCVRVSCAPLRVWLTQARGAQASATTRAARIQRRNARVGSGVAPRPPAPVSPRAASRPRRS